MPGKHKIPSWQTAAYARLRAAGEDWVQLGELYAAAEHRILPHHATRFQAKRMRLGEDASVETAKWRYFVHAISTMKVEWERVRSRYHASQPSDLLRLRWEGVCEHCGGKLYRETWSQRSHHTRCAACRAGAPRLAVAAETSEEEEPMPEPMPPHPLIGLIATRLDQRGAVIMRPATITHVIGSGNSSVGDIAILKMRDGTGTVMVSLVDLASTLWKLRDAPDAIAEEAAA